MNRLRFVACAVALGALAPATAFAHLGHEIRSAERYLKVDVAKGDARLVVSLSLAAGEALRVMQRADADHDGAVSETERAQYLAAWATALATELPLTVDGARREMRFQDGYFDPIGPISATPMTIEIVGHFVVPGGRHTLRVEDRMAFGGTIERTDVSMRARDGATLLSCGVDVARDTTRCELAMGPRRADARPSVLLLSVQLPEEGEPSAHVPWLLWLVPLVLGTMFIPLIRARLRDWRMRRRRSPR